MLEIGGGGGDRRRRLFIHTFALAFLQLRQALRVMESGTRRRLDNKGAPTPGGFSAGCLGRGSELVGSE